MCKYYAWFPISTSILVPCHSVFLIIFFKTMYYYNKNNYYYCIHSVFVISGIINSVSVTSLGLQAQLITLPSTLIILDIYHKNQLKTSKFINYHIIIIITCFRKAAQWVGETDPRKRSSSSSSTDWTAWVETTSTMSKKDSIYSQNMWIWGIVWCTWWSITIKYSSNYERSTVRWSLGINQGV